jgi:hypothetical protein
MQGMASLASSASVGAVTQQKGLCRSCKKGEMNKQETGPDRWPWLAKEKLVIGARGAWNGDRDRGTHRRTPLTNLPNYPLRE